MKTLEDALFGPPEVIIQKSIIPQKQEKSHHTCLRCQYSWSTYQLSPRICPQCKRDTWQTEKVIKPPKRIRKKPEGMAQIGFQSENYFQHD